MRERAAAVGPRAQSKERPRRAPISSSDMRRRRLPVRTLMAFRIVAGSTLRVSTAGAAWRAGRGRSEASIVGQGVCEAAAARGSRTDDGQLVRRVAQHGACVGGCEEVGGLARRRGGTSRQSPWEVSWPRLRRAAGCRRPAGAPRLLGTARWVRVRAHAPQPGRRQTRRRLAGEGWPKVRPWRPSLRAARLPTVSAAPAQAAASRCTRGRRPSAGPAPAARRAFIGRCCQLLLQRRLLAVAQLLRVLHQQHLRAAAGASADARCDARAPLQPVQHNAQSQGCGVAALAQRRCRSDSRLRLDARSQRNGQQRQAARRAAKRSTHSQTRRESRSLTKARHALHLVGANAGGARARAGPHSCALARHGRGAFASWSDQKVKSEFVLLSGMAGPSHACGRLKCPAVALNIRSTAVCSESREAAGLHRKVSDSVSAGIPRAPNRNHWR